MSSTPQTTTTPVAPPAHGFGSFHTERDEDRIDVLISLPTEQYKPPHMPVMVDLTKYPLPLSPFEHPNLFPQFTSPTPQTEASQTTTTTTSSSIPTTTTSSLNDLTTLDQDQHLTQIPFGRKVLESWYHISPEWTFINHGAFGATLKPVSEAEMLWHQYMESQPLRFIDRKLLPLLVYTTRRLANFINAPATDLVILPNVTNGLNTVLNSIQWLEPKITTDNTTTLPQQQQQQQENNNDDKINKNNYIITFDTGYGATKQIIQSTIDKFGQHIIHENLHLTFPISGPKEIVQLLRHSLRKHQKMNTLAQIKLVIVDYIQSNSALVFPIDELCQLCEQYNVPIMIDGAHSLGSFPLDINNMKSKPTFFVANAHKWLCSGKGVSLLYVNPEKFSHSKIIPAVVSHGYSSETMAGKFLWIGLQDYCHYLGLNTALDCWNKIGTNNIRNYLHGMIKLVSNYLTTMWNTDLLGPNDMFGTMVCIRLPGPRVPQSGHEHTDIQDQLYFQYNIEAPIKMLQNRLYIRVSVHIYNDWDDFKKLANAMLLLRPKLINDEDQADLEYAQTAADVVPFTSCG